jgi:ABC-type multidrug transport system fused ATPase/permease subunit
MNIAALLQPLEPEFRRRIPTMIALGVVRRLADLVGLATLLPVVVLIVWPASVAGSGLMANLFRITGLESIPHFGVALGVFALVMLPIKSVFTIWLTNYQNRWLLAIYRSCSLRLFLSHHSRGVLFIRRDHSSQLAFHINGACWGYATNIVGTVIGVAADMVMALLLVGLAVGLAPLASLAVLGTMVPVLLLWFGVVSGRLRRLGELANEARRRQSRLVQETLRGHVSMSVDGSFAAATREFSRGLKDISEADLRSGVYGQVPSLVVQLCAAVTLTVVLLTGVDGGANVATFVLFGFAAVRLMPVVLSLAGGWNRLQNSLHVVDIVAGGCCCDDVKGHGGPESLDGDGSVANEAAPVAFERGIELRDVTFAFDGGGGGDTGGNDFAEPVFNNFSMSFAKGESVGVRGASGVGKSTLFNLLMGFYTPSKGGIYIDGVRLTPATRCAWLRSVGYVEQEVFVKSDTLAANIATGGDPDTERVTGVLRRVGLGPWLDLLPDRLDTMLGEGGSNMSGGQRQRLGIARALYKRPSVLFVDEVTSALDPASEDEIVDLLRDLSSQGITMFIISHRPAALRHCNRIIDL